MDQLSCASRLSHPLLLVCCTISSMCVCMYRHIYSKSMDQPGKVANPARGQLNRENEYFPVHVHA